jgi:hypothetical protein
LRARERERGGERERERAEVEKYTPQGMAGRVGSEQGGLRVLPVAREQQCLGLDGFLYTTRGEQGETWVVLRSGFW